jgi:glycerol-3-phosphate dehydrogenase (NAD(P)+)
MQTAVLGAGSWGTAIAVLTADNGHPTRLWGRSRDQVALLAGGRENERYLPGRAFPVGLEVTDQLSRAVDGAELVVLAVPTASVRDIARTASAALAPGAILVCASKGLEADTRLTLDRVLEQAVPGVPVVLFSGPTFAQEIAQGLPAAAVVAGRDPAATEKVQRALASDAFRVYTSEDVTGVAVGGALKNVIAIAAGCSDGLGYGHNARAALITRGLHEMGRLATRLGGDPLTLAGLAGMGDLVLTCTGELSRNRKVGLALAAGEPLASIVARLGHVAEGVYTARIAATLAHELNVDMPITGFVDTVLSGTLSAREAVAGLLARSSRPERG